MKNKKYKFLKKTNKILKPSSSILLKNLIL